jgi:hypothetical protein
MDYIDKWIYFQGMREEMVHFHIHSNGYAETDNEEGVKRVVNPIITNAVWIGLACLLWTAAIFVLLSAIHEIEIIK